MKTIGFMPALALAFVATIAAVFLWQNPGVTGDRLSSAETDAYLKAADRQIALPAAEKADMLVRLRAFADHDDGRPVYMLNLMRFYPKVRALPGGPKADMSPAAANAHYERKATAMLLPMGGTAPFMGSSEGPDVLPYGAEGDNWSRMLVIRYPNRRTFLRLVADRRYPAIVPYKLASLRIVLSPFAAEMMMPDTTLTVSAVLALAFLGVGWARSERRLRDLRAPPGF
jgi:hypothetical protein